MSETQMWSYMAERLRFPAERLTDRHLEGLHDVLWAEAGTGRAGLLELKYRRKGERALTFKPGQLPFIHGWWRRGGYSAVLERDWRDEWRLYFPLGGPIRWIQDMEAGVWRPTFAWSEWPGSDELLGCLRLQTLNTTTFVIPT